MKLFLLAIVICLSSCSSLTPQERAAWNAVGIAAAHDATSIGLHRLEKLDK